MTTAHLIVFMWKEFGVTSEKVYTYWLPFLKLIMRSFSDLYRKQSNKKDTQLNADDMSLDQVRQFFTMSGIPVKEK